MTCPALRTEHECPKIGTESECLINGQRCSSIKEISLKEVDIYLHAIVDGEKMGSQIHTYTVDGEYELLPQDEDDKIPTTIWNIREIRGHIRKKVET